MVPPARPWPAAEVHSGSKLRTQDNRRNETGMGSYNWLMFKRSLNCCNIFILYWRDIARVFFFCFFIGGWGGHDARGHVRTGSPDTQAAGHFSEICWTTDIKSTNITFNEVHRFIVNMPDCYVIALTAFKRWYQWSQVADRALHLPWWRALWGHNSHR